MESKKINKERLEMLYSTNSILFGKPENGPQIEAQEYLKLLNPDERNQALANMYILYKVAMQKNLQDMHKMMGE